MSKLDNPSESEVRTLAAARADIVLSRIRSMKSKVIQFVAVAQLQSELGVL